MSLFFVGSFHSFPWCPVKDVDRLPARCKWFLGAPHRPVDPTSHSGQSVQHACGIRWALATKETASVLDLPACVCRVGRTGRRFIPNRIGRVLLPSPLRVCHNKERIKGGISVARPCLATVALACVSGKGDQRRAAGGDLVGARNFHCRILNQLRSTCREYHTVVPSSRLM